MKEIFRNSDNMNKPQDKKGFSLVEVMISTVLLMMIALLVMPNPRSRVKIAQEARLRKILDNTRRSLLQYKNDYGYFPQVGETFENVNYMYRVMTGSGNPNAASASNIPLEFRTLRLILESSLLEPQLPFEFRYAYLPGDRQYKPPYLRGDGQTLSEILWNEDTTPKGFFINPVTYEKYDWEVYIKNWITSPGEVSNPISGWFKIDTVVYNLDYWSVSAPHLLDVDFVFPPDPNPLDETNNACQIYDIRFYPVVSEADKALNKRAFYKGLNGTYYDEW